MQTHNKNDDLNRMEGLTTRPNLNLDKKKKGVFKPPFKRFRKVGKLSYVNGLEGREVFDVFSNDDSSYEYRTVAAFESADSSSDVFDDIADYEKEYNVVHAQGDDDKVYRDELVFYDRVEEDVIKPCPNVFVESVETFMGVTEDGYYEFDIEEINLDAPDETTKTTSTCPILIVNEEPNVSSSVVVDFNDMFELYDVENKASIEKAVEDKFFEEKATGVTKTPRTYDLEDPYLYTPFDFDNPSGKPETSYFSDFWSRTKSYVESTIESGVDTVSNFVANAPAIADYTNTVGEKIKDYTKTVETKFEAVANDVGTYIAVGMEKCQVYAVYVAPGQVQDQLDGAEAMHNNILDNIIVRLPGTDILGGIIDYEPQNEYNVVEMEMELDERPLIPEAQGDEKRPIDPFVILPWNRATCIDTESVNIDNYVPEYWRKVTYNLIQDKNFETLYSFLMNLTDEFTTFSVRMEVVGVATLSGHLHDHGQDVRSDQHNCGKATRELRDLAAYRVYTVQIRRNHHVLFIPKFIRECASFCRQGGSFVLSNLIEVRQTEVDLTMSPELYRHISSVRTFAPNESLEKAKANIMLAVKNNVCVNIPYSLVGDMSDPYIGTANYAISMRESYKWKTYASALDFQL